MPKKKETNNYIELRNVLMDEIRLLRSGAISEKRARVTSNLAKRVIEIGTMEMIAMKMLEADSVNEIKMLMKATNQ